jgi:hypothetical protein
MGADARTRSSRGGMQVNRALLAGVAILLAGSACDDSPPGPAPVPGEVAVTLVSPNGAEGGAVLATGEAGIVQVTAESPLKAYHWREAGEDRVVVLRDPAGEIRFRMSVADVNRPPRLDVIEVADGANRLRTGLAGYEVEIVPLPGVGP